MRRSRRSIALAVLAALSAAGGCATVQVAEELATLRIARREGPGDRWSEDRERAIPPADMGLDRLAQALRFCTQREPQKFVPR